MMKREWTFLTTHGHVFIYLAKYKQATTRQIAQESGVTERAIQKVISDLEAAGYIDRIREGRCNRYIVHPELPMRHWLEQDHTVMDILLALSTGRQSEEKRAAYCDLPNELPRTYAIGVADN